MNYKNAFITAIYFFFCFWVFLCSLVIYFYDLSGWLAALIRFPALLFAAISGAIAYGSFMDILQWIRDYREGK